MRIIIGRERGCSMDNHSIFADNLNKYMAEYGKTRRDLAEALGVSYYTITDWVKGKKYPRMDKVEMLANYFGILKSDLIEDKMTDGKEADNEALAGIIVRLRMDEDFMELVKELSALDTEQINGVRHMLQAFTK